MNIFLMIYLWVGFAWGIIHSVMLWRYAAENDSTLIKIFLVPLFFVTVFLWPMSLLVNCLLYTHKLWIYTDADEIGVISDDMNVIYGVSGKKSKKTAVKPAASGYSGAPKSGYSGNSGYSGAPKPTSGFSGYSGH